jgi:subtilisin family serine protease
MRSFPEALLTGAADIGAGAFREIVLRFTETGTDGSFGLSTVHTARWRRNAAPHEDFVFFYADEGDGMQLLPEVRAKLSPNLVAFIGELFGAGPRRDDVLNTSPLVIHGEQNQSRVILLADVDGQIQLPPQVITMDLDGPLRTLSAPADGAVIAAIAQQPAVKRLGVVPPGSARNDVARTVVNLAGLNAKIPAAKQGGANVVVGVIDTGIDGGHPAVAGRVHSYWDQATTPAAVVLHGNSPAQNHPGNAAYALFHFGVELTGPATVNAQDPGGHGTHVAATCAGRDVTDGAGHVTVPAGMAPNALIVAVRAIEIGAANCLLAIRYIFQKATELGLPCVINMSFGEHYNPHDGTNGLARELLRTVQDAAGAYRPGRILVAAAGNERNKQYHLRRQLPPRGTRTVADAAVQLPIQLRPSGREPEIVHIWIRNPTGVCPTAFPLRIWVFRRSSSHGRNTPVSMTRFVTLGEDTTGTPTGAGTFTSHRVRVDIASSLWDSFNGDFSVQVTLSSTDVAHDRGMMDGQWVVALDNGSTSSLDVHAWLAKTARSTFIDAAGDDDDAFLIGMPANSPGVISVASVNSRLSWTNTLGNFLFPNEANTNDLSSFSSPGPLRAPSIALTTVYPTVHHEVNGVDVSAPGCRILSALSRQISQPPNPSDLMSPVSWLLQGTSMASPVVTGVIANILADSPTPAAAPTLPQVLDLLKNASSIPAASVFQPPPATPPPARPYSQDWGYGLLDAARLRP